VVDDRPCGAERVGADAEHDGVAGAHDATGVREDVRSTLEDEPDDAEGRSARLDRPGVVFDVIDEAVTTAGGIAPSEQAAHHVGAHPLVEDQPCGRTSGCRSSGDVGGVRGGDRCEPIVVRQRLGEPIEEVADLLVARCSEGGERLAGVGHGIRDQRADVRRDQQERSGGLYDDQTVAVAEAFGQLGGYHGNPVAAERDLLSFGDAGERSYLGLRRHGVSVGTCPRLRSTSVSCSPGVTSPSVTRSPRRW
jgi:hypothetical protein